MWKVILLLANQELICVEFADRGFVRAVDFPKVSNFIYLDGLAYVSSTKIDNGDLSFHVQNEPLLVD